MAIMKSVKMSSHLRRSRERPRIASVVELTGQVPPLMILSKERGSGMPAHMLHELALLMDSSMDFCLV